MSPSKPADISLPSGPNRRDFLFVATAAVGAVGVATAAWPFIDQMNPDAGIRAASDIVAIELTGLRPAEHRLVHWHNLPIFVVRRTPQMLAAMQEKAFVATLVDPDSQTRQQPAYARNWHRSVDPAYAVLLGVCTYCGCVPLHTPDASPPDLAGGFVCPCCASRFDPAGRAAYGPAPYNLPVPPYSIEGSRVLVGKNASRDAFTLQSIERI